MVKKKKRYYPKKRPVVKVKAEGDAEGEAEGGGDGEEGAAVEVKKPRRKKYDGPVYGAPDSYIFVSKLYVQAIIWRSAARQRCEVRSVQRGLVCAALQVICMSNSEFESCASLQ